MILRSSRPRRALAALVTAVTALALMGTGGLAAVADETPVASASLSGVVTDASTGEGIADASVVILDAAGAEAAAATTGTTGGYTVSGLAEGQYTVSVSAAPSYEPAYWAAHGAVSAPGGAETVGLAAGETRVGVDVTLTAVLAVEPEEPAGEPAPQADGSTDAPIAAETQAPDAAALNGPAAQRQIMVAADAPATGTISGKITRTTDGSPVEGASVSAFSDSGNGWSDAASAADGTFTIDGLMPDEYRIFVQTPADSGLASAYWGGWSWDTAGLVQVRAGEDTPNINVALGVPGSVSGRVVRDSDGEPLAGMTVSASQPDGSGGSAISAADGSYLIESLAPGTYDIYAWYGGADYTGGMVTGVVVASGAVTADVIVRMSEVAIIRGTVSADGAPVSGATVQAWPTTSVPGNYGDIVWTEQDGTFELRVAQGSYTVRVASNVGSYAEQYYNGAATESEAAVITLDAGEIRENIDFALVQGAGIEGTVSAESWTPGAWATATAYRWNGDAWHTARSVTAWGDYSFDRWFMSDRSGSLPAGTYTVGFEAEGYCPQFFDNAASLATATQFELAAGDTRTGINAHLTTECESRDVVAGVPTISGSAVVGETLTAQPGTWGPNPVELSYQWSADGAAISSATATTLALTEAERGKKITVTVTGTRPGYTTATATSAAVGPVSAAPLRDLTVGTPTISGTPRVGATLTAAPGAWGPAPVDFTYQWQVDGADVAGATGSTFVPDAAALDKSVSVTVHGTKAGYNPAFASSAPVGAVARGILSVSTPTFAGPLKVGTELVVLPGDWQPAPVTFTYQWFADGALIADATADRFTPDASLVGVELSVAVTGSKVGYDAATRTATAGIVPPTIVASDQRVVPGTPIVVTGENFLPGEEVELVLHSDPIHLLTVRAAADGTFRAEVTIPASAPFGSHTIVATGVTSKWVATTPIEVYDPTVPPAPAPGGGGSASTPGLAATGAEIPLGMLVLALGLLMTGGVLAWRRRMA